MEPEISVLAVDDVPQNLAAIEALLARPQLQVVKAASGREALEHLLEHEVAVALVDVQMPGMNGFELAELMRGAARTRTIPIIFMTAGSSDPGRTFQGYEAGAVDFLHKPLEPIVLKSKVDVFVELYRQRRRLATQLDELRDALRLNEMFAAVLSHDLRNPLNAISMGVEVLVRQSDAPAVTAVAERIRSSTQRMAKMIDELLNVARIRASGVSLTVQSADVMEVCESIREELERTWSTERIAVQAWGDTRAEFDVERLSQVFSNLLGNGLQHSEPESPIEVEIDGEAAEALQIRVRSRGLIAGARMKTLFEPFQRGTSARSGFGLGLYIVKQFIEAHGGRIGAKSDDQHTVFDLTLPRKPPAVEGEAPTLML
jgi:signal transduction histidine kinase